LAARLAEDLELRGQFHRLQQADAAIKAAFANVHVPAGLADRVSRRLAEAAPAAISEALPAVDSLAGRALPESGLIESGLTESALTGPDSPAPLRAQTGRFSWRRLLVGFTALSAAAALFAAVWIQTHRPRHETPDSVLDEAMNFFDKDNNQPPGELVAPPVEYPRDIVRLDGVRCDMSISFWAIRP